MKLALAKKRLAIPSDFVKIGRMDAILAMIASIVFNFLLCHTLFVLSILIAIRSGASTSTINTTEQCLLLFFLLFRLFLQAF